MIFRKIDESERQTASRLQTQSFHFAYDPTKKMPWETCRAAFDGDGRMTACLELIPYDVWFDGRTAGMGGVGGVASLPEFRRGGHVRGLFGFILEEMYERGDVFSYLFPFSNAYYRKFGYEQGCRTLQVTLPLEDLLPLARPGRAAQFLPGGDPEPIVTIYNEYASRYNLMADRTGCQWQSRLEVDPCEKLVYSYVWYDEKDRPAAYFQYRFQENSQTPRAMNVTDMAWRNHEGLLGMLGFMGRFAGNLEKAVITAGPDFVPEIIFPEYNRMEMKAVHLGMNRVVNVRRALEMMRKPAGGGRAAVRVVDGSAPWNDGVWRIEWERGAGEVNPAAGPPDLTCSAPALSQLVTGYLPFEQLCLRQDVEVAGGEETLSRLFAHRKIMISDYF